MVMMDHLGLDHNSAELAILTGDFRRAGVIAEAFGAKLVTDRRGFPCYLAPDWQRPIAIVGTGIGGPATAIVAEELIALGVRAIIRLGTCGGLQPEVAPGHLIVPTGCVRDEGTSRAYVDLAFPALSHTQLAGALAAAAHACGATIHVGITHCKDAYYSEKRGMLPDPIQAEIKWKTWRAAGVLATEMESAALFIVASLRRIAAGGIFVVVGKTQSQRFDTALQLAIASCKGAFSSFIESGGLDGQKPRVVSTGESFLSTPVPAVVPGSTQ